MPQEKDPELGILNTYILFYGVVWYGTRPFLNNLTYFLCYVVRYGTMNTILNKDMVWYHTSSGIPNPDQPASVVRDGTVRSGASGATL